MSNARLAVLTATIADGASLSGAVHVDGRSIVGIQMPGTWTSADLTFQVSADGATYGNVYTTAGVELTATNGSATSRYIVLDPLNFLGANYIKVRSGTSGSAVNQSGAARALSVVVREFA